VKLVDVIEEIPDEKTARHFMMVGAITSGIVAVAMAIPGVLSGHPLIPESLFFAFASWRIWRASRGWAGLATVAFLAEKIFQFILVPVTGTSVGDWAIAILFLCGFIAGVRGTYAFADLKLDDNPYARL
jgi:hypothetical protein